MKRLLLNIVIIVIVKSFILAAPPTNKNITKVTCLKETTATVSTNTINQYQSEFEIHPMDVLNLKFK